jgi:uncharacterized spore protein YtfJ
MDERIDLIVKQIEQMLDRLSVNDAFGEPIKEGEVTVIPVAGISAGFGFGGGSGREPGEADQETAEAVAEGWGFGGGAGGRASPRGYIQITSEGVEFEPIMNVGLIALAGIALSAWIVFWVGIRRMIGAK